MNENRMLWMVVVPAVTGLALYGLFHYWMRPAMYDGDRTEVRNCRMCSGQSQGCRSCGGDNKVKVIVPGPNRPTLVYGDVYDEKIRNPKNVRWVPIPGKATFRDAPPGAIQNAKVVFAPAKGKPAEITSSNTGRFRVSLPPGNYKITATADGFKNFEQELEIPGIKGFIWLEDKPEPAQYYTEDDNLKSAIEEISIGIGLLK